MSGGFPSQEIINMRKRTHKTKSLSKLHSAIKRYAKHVKTWDRIKLAVMILRGDQNTMNEINMIIAMAAITWGIIGMIRDEDHRLAYLLLTYGWLVAIITSPLNKGY